MRSQFFASAILIAALAPVALGDYTTTILTPPGAFATADAISNGQQGGAVLNLDSSRAAHFWTGASPGDDYSGTYASSMITGLSSTQAVGFVVDSANPTNPQAAYWNLTNSAPQLLLASNGTETFATAQAIAIGGSLIVGAGSVTNPGTSHALAWNNSAAAPTDLHNFTGFAAAYTESSAAGTDGTHVVGNAGFTATGSPHAVLWNITAGTFTDLHDSTTGLQNSQATSIASDQIVGFGLTDLGPTSPTIALLWTLSGPEDSVIKYTPLVTPAGYTSAEALATNGTLTVGSAIDATGLSAAVLWTSPTSYEILPGTTGSSSRALAIDADGNIVGDSFNPTAFTADALLWSPSSVPEPASLSLLLAPAAGLLLRRRRKS